MITTFLRSLKWFGLRKLYWVTRGIAIDLNERIIDAGLSNQQHNQSLVKRRIARKLIEVFNGDEGHNIDSSQFFLGFGLIHYTLVRNIRPTNVLCIGSRRGFIPAILALACKDNSNGHVDFVDAGYDQTDSKKSWSGVGFWKNHDPAKHFNKLEISQHITTHVMTNREFAKKIPLKKYQYIYIDGDHSYEGVKLDYQLFWPKLEKGGFMAFHDVSARGYLDNGLFGVWRFWKRIQNKHSIIFPFPKESGLGIIQK